MKRWGILGILISFVLLLTGCESILLDADLDSAQVEEYDPDRKYVEATQLDTMQKENEATKYDVEGKEAFYILPPHQPAPDTILQFELLDVIDGTTSIYAYQALCEETVSDGLRGEPASGIAKEGHKESLQKAATGSKMATILMSYNTETKQYQVFFHQLGDAELLETESDEGMTSPVAEEQTMFAQKMGANGENYFIYYDEIIRIYNQTGTKVYEKDLSDLLSMNTSKYGGEGAELTIQDIVVDKNYFIYISMSIEKQGAEINEDTEEDDLDDEGESDVLQMLYSCFYLDVGGKDEWYFISENTNYEKQVQEWRDNVDGDIYKFDTSSEPSTDLIHQTVPTMESIVKDYPDTYSIYTFSESSLPLQLYYYDGAKYFFWYWQLGWFWDGNKLRYGTAYLSEANAKSLSGKKNEHFRQYIAGYKNEDGEITISKEFLFPRYTLPEKQIAEKETLKRTYTIEWTEEQAASSINTETEQETTSTTSTKREKTITETVDVIKRYTVRFPKNTILQWSEPRYTADMITNSAGSGVVRFGDDADGEYAKDVNSFVTTEQHGRMFYYTNIPGKARNAEVIYYHDVSDGKEKPILILCTTEGIAVFPEYASVANGSWNGSSSSRKMISYTDINFGLSVDEDEGDRLNLYQRLDFNLTDEERMKEENMQGQNEELSVSESDTADNYESYSAVFVQSDSGDDYLYLTGLNNGLVKYNLSADSADTIKAGQVSSYPYYGIWLKEGEEDSCFVIGYQSTEYTYQEMDITRARIYEVPLLDEEACVNLVSSAMGKHIEVQKNIANGDDGTWNMLRESLGIQSVESESLATFWGKIQAKKQKRDETIRDIYDLIQLENSKRTAETRTKIEKCYYSADLEDTLEEIKGKPASELRENIGMTRDEWEKKLQEFIDILTAEEE